MVFFGDFNKTANDILKAKKFNFYKALEIKVDQKNNFSWSAKTNLSEGKSTSKSEFVFEQKEDGLGKLKCTFNNPEKMSLEASSKDAKPLTELKVKIEHENFEVTAQYDQDNFGSKLKFKNNKDYSLTPNVSYQAGDFTLGAEAKLNQEDGLKDYSLGFLYRSGKNQQVSVQATNQLNDVTVSGYLDRSEVGKLCGQVVAKNVQGGSPDISAEVGGLYGLNEKSKLRWKYAVNESALSGVYEYSFREGVKGSFSAGYNVATRTMTGVNWKAEIQV